MAIGLTDEDLAVLRALPPSGGTSAEALRLTTPYGVPALLRALAHLERLGYAEVVGPRGQIAAETAYKQTGDGAALATAQP
jgi:hypothetical protein